MLLVLVRGLDTSRNSNGDWCTEKLNTSINQCEKNVSLARFLYSSSILKTMKEQYVMWNNFTLILTYTCFWRSHLLCSYFLMLIDPNNSFIDFQAHFKTTPPFQELTRSLNLVIVTFYGKTRLVIDKQSSLLQVVNTAAVSAQKKEYM